MPIDGIIILESTGRPIIQSGFRSTSTAYPLLHIDALNNALEVEKGDVDPVIHVPGYSVDGNQCACCHVGCADMRILAPISGDVDPLYAFAFLQTFVEILQDYFGQLSATTLKENFDVVYQLLEETLDSIGFPNTTSPNALRDIVLPPTLLQKIMTVTGVAGLANTSTGSSTPFASPIPWRKAGLRYNNNEIYFDVVEKLRAIVGRSARNGTIVMSEVWGKIESNAHLSGTPDLLLNFSNPRVLTDWSFHPCVRLQRWNRDKALSFVPPDGKFTLMEYRFAPPASTSLSAPPNQVPVPFSLKPTVKLDEDGGSLDLMFLSRLSTRSFEEISVELYLGEGTTSNNFVASSNTTWGFDPKANILRWEMKNVPPSGSYTLRGSWSSSVKYPRPSPAFRIRYDVVGYSYSALKVDQLKVTGESYKPYKGVRGSSNGDIEWRW